MATTGDPITDEVKRRAVLFVDDNFTNPTPSDYLIIQTAMMVGASIALEKNVDELRKEISHV